MKTYYSIPLIAVFAVSLFLLACKKKDSFMDVGKYHVIRYITYPNGTKDTVDRIAYGPRLKSDSYIFDIKRDGSEDTPLIMNKAMTIIDINAGGMFVINSYSKTASFLEISFSPNYDFPVGDSASGIITFNRIPS